LPFDKAIDGWQRQAQLADGSSCGEGVSPLRVEGILPATQKSKARMASPREAIARAFGLAAATRLNVTQ
jgi:hypothetical protein